MTSLFFYPVIYCTLCQLVNAGIIGSIFDTVKNLQKVDDLNELVDIVKNNNIFEYPLVAPSNANVSKYVSFHLFTRQNPKNEYILKTGDTVNVKKSPLNPDLPTKVIIHGWLDSSERLWIQEIRDVYLSIGDYNVIVVDWSAIAWRSYYLTAAPSTRAVGDEVTLLLKSLISTKSLSLSKIHLVGYSLGGQISGFVGSNLSGKIGRITGLDPAGPAFEFPFLKKKDERLDSSDAIFVDVIHTSGGDMGFMRPIGHVDFYPNGGVARQPGCSILNSVYCSHHAAPEFMIGSIKHKESFVARRCTDWTSFERRECENGGKAFMGEYATSDLRGLYYLKTDETAI